MDPLDELAAQAEAAYPRIGFGRRRLREVLVARGAQAGTPRAGDLYLARAVAAAVALDVAGD